MELKFGKHIVLIDDEDRNIIEKYKVWNVIGKKYKYLTAITWDEVKGINTHLRFHRLIMPVSEDMLVDHKNHNTLDNRKENLRVCDKLRNRRNSKASEGRFKGVSSMRGRWQARITVNGNTINLGSFRSEVQAAVAYDTAAIKYFLDFACVNFPTREDLYAACKEEASNIISKIKDLYSPNGIVDDAKNGGGQYAGSAPGYSQNVGDVMKSYMQYLPQLAQVTARTQPGIDMSQARSAAAAAPVYNQANLDMYNRYAPQLAKTGQQIGQSNAMAGAGSNAAVLGSGAAQQGTASANSLEQQANPEFYQTRALASSKLGDLMNSINLNGLSGSERAEVERSLGQSQNATGNLGIDNATNATGNAMTFGSALQGKRDAMAQAIGTATNFLPQSKSSFDPVSMALTGNPATSTATGQAAGQFSGVNPAGNQSFAMGNNTMNALNTSNVANQAMQYSANQGNSFGGILNSQTGAVGNLCCFIFLEANNGTLPWWVRKCRDRYYSVCPEVAYGYKRMAKWLVPLMRHIPVVRWSVQRWMVQPLTLYGGFIRRVEGHHECGMFRSYRRFWFTIWNIMGRI